MSKILFSTVTGLGVLGVGGGIYFASRSSKIVVERENIESKLLKDKYQPLIANDTKHDSYWSKSLEKYNLTRNGEASYTKKQLQGLCSLLFKKEKINSDDYNVSKKYCVISRKVSERLKDLGFKVLSSTSSDQALMEKWKKLSAQYKSKGTGENQLSDLLNSSVNEQEGTVLKNKCGSIFDREHWDSDYDVLLEGSKIWCTEEGFNKIPSVVSEKQ